MATEEVFEFLEQNPNIKFMAKDVAGALDAHIKQIHKAIRKLTDKKNIHYDNRIKKESGYCKVIIESYINKTHTSRVLVLYFWFEKKVKKNVKRKNN